MITLPDWLLNALPKIAIIATVASALVTEVYCINPLYGAIAVLVSVVFGSFGKAVAAFTDNHNITLAGLLFVVGSVALAVLGVNDTLGTSPIAFLFGPKALTAIGHIGAIAMIVGRALTQPPPPSNTGGSGPRANDDDDHDDDPPSWPRPGFQH
jgi:hypothetical protein